MKNLISKEEMDQIDSICKEYGISNYSINSDGSIDVNGHVDLSVSNLTSLPLKFDRVDGMFDCSRNKLTTLDGAPNYARAFDCSNNNLTSLENGPNETKFHYACDSNRLVNLVGVAQRIGTYLSCRKNRTLISLYANTDIDLEGNFYRDMQHMPSGIFTYDKYMKQILRYQRHFEIWNDDHTLNVVNFKELIAEIEDGLE
jgi:hypothetical protein